MRVPEKQERLTRFSVYLAGNANEPGWSHWVTAGRDADEAVEVAEDVAAEELGKRRPSTACCT